MGLYAGGNPRGSETVLLVDPEPEPRKLAAFMLQKQGYAVLEARSAEEALKLSDTHSSEIDLLLTEIRIPRMSGRDLADRLISAHPALRVLYMSHANTDVGSGRAFLPKPFIMRELANKVRQVLDTPRAVAADAG
jgi:DNA-binding response OmpR family regulator